MKLAATLAFLILSTSNAHAEGNPCRATVAETLKAIDASPMPAEVSTEDRAQADLVLHAMLLSIAVNDKLNPVARGAALATANALSAAKVQMLQGKICSFDKVGAVLFIRLANAGVVQVPMMLKAERL